MVLTEPEVFTRKQQEFLAAVDMGMNIYLTGYAGTGKSFITRKAIARLQEAGRKVMAVAPTGVAANNIDGETMHSTFALSPYGCLLSMDDCNFVRKAKREVLQKVEVIIMDEISMARPDMIDAMHLTLIKNGIKNGLKGKQLIFVGDLCQLPPVMDDNMRSVLLSKYDGDTFLDAKLLQEIQITKIELDEVKRQNDVDFIEALNRVRDGVKASDYFKQFIHTEPHGIVLAPYNATVAKYNEEGLAAQPGDVFEFKAKVSGAAKPEDFSLENEIRVKNGCKIMYLVNSRENPLRNGTLGIFVSHQGCHFIRVGNVDFALKEVTVLKKEYVYDSRADALVLQEKGSITQHPFKLAYALSIHKSQGLTFDQVTIDLRRPCFINNQYYVALSRATGPAALRIIVK
jgi:ATP-dependent DNA helicase PIF1